MAREYHRLLLLFVDGIGLAPASPDNPLATEVSSTMRGVLGGPLTCEQVGEIGHGSLTALDANLGLPGLPQSATGQATLFTGVNAAQWMGRHVTGLPGPRLRSLVADKSLFRSAAGLGLHTTFANAYGASYLESLLLGTARPSVTTCAALAAGLKLRTVDDLKAGRAATWDVVGDLFASRANVEVPAIDPKTVGNRLSTLAASHDLTVFETFLPDLAGHGRIGIAAAEVVRRLDQLMAGVLAASADQVTVLLTSDHGNFEQRSTRSHTRNQVPWLTTGPFAHCFTGLGSLADVAPRILEVLSAVPGKASS